MAAPKTRGISPKVYIPAIGQALAGVALIIAGLDVEGRTAIGTGLGTLILGFSASPGPLEDRRPGEL